jgi:phosphoglucosamine mutase
MADRKYFGTDGIRGKVGESVITPRFILKLGWAVGQTFKKKSGRSKVIIGKDTRISGYMFESALEAGLSAAGVDACLLGPMPTPAIAYMTRTFRACAGIVISASHNPYYDNGIKFFSGQGFKLHDSTEEEIEHWIDQEMSLSAPSELGKAFRVDDAAGRYVEYCKGSIPSGMTLSGLKVVLDCAHGATYHVAPSVFEELGASVKVIGNKPDGVNINEKVGSTHPEALISTVIEEGADIGIAFDGDGDRVLMVDHKGELVDGDELIFCIAKHRALENTLGGGVVGTLMTNFGAEMAYRELGVDFKRVNVGDRYVMEALQEHGWFLGGEGSGHIVCLDKGTTGDGIISALQVLVAMSAQEVSLHELKSAMTKLPQVMINVRVKDRFDPLDREDVRKAVAWAESELQGAGRTLLRASGTEPLIRVMVEGEDAEKTGRLANELAAAVEKAAG